MDTSQNFPIQENLTLPDNIDPRIPHIVEQRLSGKTWTQIGQNLDLTRRAIYDIRQKEGFTQLIQILIPKYLKTIETFLDSDNNQMKMEAAKEWGRMIRAETPKQIHQQTDKRIIHITLTPFPQPNT